MTSYEQVAAAPFMSKATFINAKHIATLQEVPKFHELSKKVSWKLF